MFPVKLISVFHWLKVFLALLSLDLRVHWSIPSDHNQGGGGAWTLETEIKVSLLLLSVPASHRLTQYCLFGTNIVKTEKEYQVSYFCSQRDKALRCCLHPFKMWKYPRGPGVLCTANGCPRCLSWVSPRGLTRSGHMTSHPGDNITRLMTSGAWHPWHQLQPDPQPRPLVANCHREDENCVTLCHKTCVTPILEPHWEMTGEWITREEDYHHNLLFSKSHFLSSQIDLL